MSEAQVTVLIPTRTVFDGICLTIESIRKRTRGPVDTIVCDNSLGPMSRECSPPWTVPEGEDDGNRRDYLRDMAHKRLIRLIENDSQREGKYGHGENIRVMMEAVDTPYAMVFNSSSEILAPSWLDILTAQMTDPERILGIADFHVGGARNHDFITPLYWPNMMLLNVPLFRKFYPENNWDLEITFINKFHRPEIFAGKYPAHPEHVPPIVFCDTGWRLWEKMEYDNPGGVRILPLPGDYKGRYITWLGGIDRCVHCYFKPGEDSYNKRHVVNQRAEIARRLERLRAN